jgi:hypothetical protein
MKYSQCLITHSPLQCDKLELTAITNTSVSKKICTVITIDAEKFDFHGENVTVGSFINILYFSLQS